MQKKNAEKLKKYLNIIKSHYNIEEIINQKQDKSAVSKYYATSALAYFFLFSRSGFKHMGISRNGIFKKADFLEQANTVNFYLKKVKAKQVLELGAGGGSNSAYLAKINPSVNFLGVDLSTKSLKQNRNIKNFHQSLGDYHTLDIYNDGSFDVVFAIETICHSNNKAIVLKEVYRKLKKGGYFIIFDGYASRLLKDLSPEEQLAAALTEKTLSVDKFENVKEFENKISKSKFKLVKKEDLSNYVLPTMKALEKQSLLIYRFNVLVVILIKIIPFDVIKGSIAGLLMPYTMQSQIFAYYLHILQK